MSCKYQTNVNSWNTQEQFVKALSLLVLLIETSNSHVLPTYITYIQLTYNLHTTYIQLTYKFTYIIKQIITNSAFNITLQTC